MNKALITLLSLLLFECSQIAGTSDETSTGTRSARVLKPDLTPAVGAKVVLFMSGDTSRVPVKLAFSDKNGECSFEVKSGYYNIWVESDSLTAYRDSVFFNPLPVDSSSMVLSKTGSISGYIRLQPGDNPVEVYVGALGTYKFSNVNEYGHFVISGLAQGEYTLRLVNTKNSDYTPTFVVVNSYADSAVQLKDTINLVYSGIPSVYGINAYYDSITGFTSISWKRSSYIYLDKYIVYRRQSEMPYNQNVQIGMTSDTSFTDLFAGSSGVNQSVRYSVAILSQTGKYGNAYVYTDVHVCSPESLLNKIAPANGSSVGAGDLVNLVWEKVPGAHSYEVQLSKNKTFSDTLKAFTQTDTQVSISSLESSCYFWKFRVKKSDGQCGPWSSPGMFGVGVFAYPLDFLKGTLHHPLMTGNKSGELILHAHDDNKSTPYVVCIDSTGSILWQKDLSSGENGEYIGIKGVYSTDDYFLVELETSKDSSLIIKYSNSGTELWKKKMEKYRSFQLVKKTGIIVLGMREKIVTLNANGDLLNETVISDSLHCAIQKNDTAYLYVKHVDMKAVVIMEYRTITKHSIVLDSIVLPGYYYNFYCWVLNDGSVNIAIYALISNVVLNITTEGKIKRLKNDADYLISLNQNSEKTTVCFYNQTTQTRDLYDENMNIKAQLKRDGDPNTLNSYIFTAWDIRDNWEAYAILQTTQENVTMNKSYLLRFPISAKPMYPDEILSR